MKFRLFLAILLLGPLAGCDTQKSAKNPPTAVPSTPSAEVSATQTPSSPKKTSTVSQIRSITRSESVIQRLAERNDLLARMLKGETVRTALFTQKEVEYWGIDAAIFDGAATRAEGDVASITDLVASRKLPIDAAPKTVVGSEIWQELPDFEDAQLGIVRGKFLEESLFETEIKFEGRIGADSGLLRGVKSKLKVVWENIGNGWKVSSWKPTEFKLLTADIELFRDSTDLAFEEETRKKLAVASQEDLIVSRCLNPREIDSNENGQRFRTVTLGDARSDFKGCNDWGSAGQYPCVSTVDFDNDGFDDLFVTDLWQAPQLLRNNGDFTFTDVTASAGIDVEEMANCGFFFDFDNDGDSDLLIGMSMVPSLFFVNEGGTFRRHEAINQTLAKSRFVNAISATDINRDGLLDLYLSTYMVGMGPVEDWIAFATWESEREKTQQKMAGADRFIDRVGPPNIVLLNRGDGFEWAEIDDTLKQYRNSYQSSWMDFDNDGDHDLYICNDFSPDVFLRNDTPRGSYQLAFVDITRQIVPTRDMGFGMGCDWADFDNDGDLDLYVSNMYSKAGNRILDLIDGTRPQLRVAAHGNFMFENQGEKFRQVAGNGDGDQHVARVGWSYGGQFADFDNDGQMDLYVPSGNYSAPDPVKTKIDL